MTHYYSPYTGEHIQTDNPADWMEQTDIAPPAFDAQAAGCFFRNGAWEVVTPEAAPGPSKAEKIRAIEATYADAQARLNRQVALSVILDKARADDAAIGMTRGQVHEYLIATQPNSAYSVMTMVEELVEAERGGE